MQTMSSKVQASASDIQPEVVRQPRTGFVGEHPALHFDAARLCTNSGKVSASGASSGKM